MNSFLRLQAALEKLGITLMDSNGQFKSFIDILDEIAEKLEED